MVGNQRLIFLFLNQNISCGYSKEPSHSDGSFEYPKQMVKLIGKKIFNIFCAKKIVHADICHNWCKNKT